MACTSSWLALAAVLIVLSLSPETSAAQKDDRGAYYDQLSASESYYTLNVDEGSMTVRAGITIESLADELETIFFWAMPTAENTVITIDGDALESGFVPGDPETGQLSEAQANLPTPIVGSQRVQATLIYDVAPYKGHDVRMEPGLMELAFLGQGMGSFILLDLPADANNFIDPGCVFATHQPLDVKDAGFERYVCGEASLVAISADDPEVIHDCARVEERCRQRFSINPYSAYVQSITDESKLGALETDLELGERTVHLELLYFLTDREWAERQFDIAQRAFPLLEELFGFEYAFDSLTMRESHKLSELGIAGVAFPMEGELLLTAG